VSALVVGLGNPGPTYAATRHNVGQMVVDELARRAGATFKRHKANAQAGTIRLGEAAGFEAVTIAKPNTFMNVSGGPVAGLAKFYSTDPTDVVVIHDDLDIPFGDVRLKRGGGEGGHNGLRDITKALGTKEYVRVRVGVGRPPGRQDAAEYVLKPFSAAERKELALVVSDAADAVELLFSAGLEAAQQKYHSPA